MGRESRKEKVLGKAYNIEKKVEYVPKSKRQRKIVNLTAALTLVTVCVGLLGMFGGKDFGTLHFKRWYLAFGSHMEITVFVDRVQLMMDCRSLWIHQMPGVPKDYNERIQKTCDHLADKVDGQSIVNARDVACSFEDAAMYLISLGCKHWHLLWTGSLILLCGFAVGGFMMLCGTLAIIVWHYVFGNGKHTPLLAGTVSLFIGGAIIMLSAVAYCVVTLDISFMFIGGVVGGDQLLIPDHRASLWTGAYVMVVTGAIGLVNGLGALATLKMPEDDDEDEEEDERLLKA
uniref:Uncharacterized protein n=1 Tax=Chromera velia CCMP2878 TaxID=1169474 RepID=A0A0G4IG33_9ALVE|mmetsp:Transcript_2825/g.5858  ORF Transcript_2825/g.5858 Transcript_2825/m.5858 type:complete len:288 (-) Transcript_2825:917-1780(-)|eukprot:Cvel_14172.t1-p1 / transcript=Cvel_14172.t1 / gene=Cvel_14172 / organism=Chromera_velia_CCMP2878 / gene_product=hypothetical protein / transcript_product=hypothetical protein / location=Cvel_scaffold999:14358-15976(+) / protein_length=287 / sequence_SO=supercontig / SO=protein_coding / is_pseudo=false